MNNTIIAHGADFTVGHAAVRTEEPTPRDFRVAEYPDGSRRVQALYRWHAGPITGCPMGHTWRDLPLVKVDAHGEALL